MKARLGRDVDSMQRYSGGQQPRFSDRNVWPSGSLSFDFKTEIPTAALQSARLFAAKSFFVDRSLPHCEEIILPARQSPLGTRVLSVHVEEGVKAYRGTKSVARRIKHKLLSQVFRQSTTKINSSFALDFRENNPRNWAHLLIEVIPLYLHIVEQARIVPDDVTLLFPRDMPQGAKELLDSFKFPYVCDSGPVSANFIRFNLEPWIYVRNLQREWVISSAVGQEILLSIEENENNPKKIFLVRRGTRTLTDRSEKEVAEYLSQFDYKKVYAEDFAPTEQLSLLAFATDIVAIHGAGLAPLIFRRPDGLPFRLVELLPAGHVDRCFQKLADEVGGTWAGVRGRLKPAYIRAGYDFETRFRKFSNDTFDVDLESVGRALEYVDHGSISAVE